MFVVCTCTKYFSHDVSVYFGFWTIAWSISAFLDVRLMKSSNKRQRGHTSTTCLGDAGAVRATLHDTSVQLQLWYQLNECSHLGGEREKISPLSFWGMSRYTATDVKALILCLSFSQNSVNSTLVFGCCWAMGVNQGLGLGQGWATVQEWAATMMVWSGASTSVEWCKRWFHTMWYHMEGYKAMGRWLEWPLLKVCGCCLVMVALRVAGGSVGGE